MDVKQPKIFVNHDRQDAAFAKLLVDRLRARYGDVAVLSEEDLVFGDSWSETTREQISNSSVVLILIGLGGLGSNPGEKASSSTINFRELVLEYAFEDHSKTVIPILIDGAEMPSNPLPEPMSRVQYIQALHISTTDDRFDADLQYLFDALDKGHGFQPADTRKSTQTIAKFGYSAFVFVLGMVVVLWGLLKFAAASLWVALSAMLSSRLVLALLAVSLPLLLLATVASDLRHPVTKLKTSLKDWSYASATNSSANPCHHDGSSGPPVVALPAPSVESDDPLQQADIAVGQCEVTFNDFQLFAAANDAEIPDDEGWGRGLRPVINVAFEDDILKYLKWLSRVANVTYRLPTLREWRALYGVDVAAGVADEAAFPRQPGSRCKSCDTPWTGKSTQPAGYLDADKQGDSALGDDARGDGAGNRDGDHERHRNRHSDDDDNNHDSRYGSKKPQSVYRGMASRAFDLQGNVSELVMDCSTVRQKEKLYQHLLDNASLPEGCSLAVVGKSWKTNSGQPRGANQRVFSGEASPEIGFRVARVSRRYLGISIPADEDIEVNPDNVNQDSDLNSPDSAVNPFTPAESANSPEIFESENSPSEAEAASEAADGGQGTTQPANPGPEQQRPIVAPENNAPAASELPSLRNSVPSDTGGNNVLDSRPTLEQVQSRPDPVPLGNQ